MEPCNEPSVVCYHYPCIDGVFSALAAFLHFKERGAQVKFIPLTVYRQHSVQELQLNGDETVYMCDFTGPAGFVEELAVAAKRVVLLDHHKTAIDWIQSPEGNKLPDHVDKSHLDLERSGATIARDYFKPTLTSTLQHIYRFVEDADLWRWVLPDSQEFYAGLAALGLEFDIIKNPSIFDTLQGLSIEQLIESGRQLKGEEDRLISAALKTVFRVQLGGDLGRAQGWGICLAVRAEDGLHKLRSRLGNELALMSAAQGLQAIGLIAYREAGMEDPTAIKLSLRGCGDTTDTTPISLAFGGGGHRLASSCNTSMVEFDAWKLTV